LATPILEHFIRDENDYRRHLDYLHYNPVKHGYVDRAADWPYSSFHRWVKKGIYPREWGIGYVDDNLSAVKILAHDGGIR
jgi:putative transposase